LVRKRTQKYRDGWGVSNYDHEIIKQLKHRLEFDDRLCRILDSPVLKCPYCKVKQWDFHPLDCEQLNISGDNIQLDCCDCEKTFKVTLMKKEKKFHAAKKHVFVTSTIPCLYGEVCESFVEDMLGYSTCRVCGKSKECDEVK
jgi:hypothetical protein